MKDKRQDIKQIISAVAIVLAAVGTVIGAVYLLTGAVSADALRWWATVATLLLPVAIVITWRVATKAAREHLAGFDRGLDGAERTMQHVGRGLSATASMARAMKSQPAPTHDDLLPKVGQMQIIDAPPGGDAIDL